MVVFETEQTADGPALTPRNMCLELNITRRRRELELELEE